MPYLVMTAPAGLPSATFDSLLADLQDREGWRLAASAFGLAALVRGERPPEVTPIKTLFKTDGIIIGRIFDRSPGPDGQARRAELAGLTEVEPVEACRALTTGCFGAYVAILARDRSEPAILRSPTGMLDALTWRKGDVTFVADDLPTGAAAPDDLAIDWYAVGAVLAHSIRAVARVPLSGVRGLDPGVCRHGPKLSRESRLWSPAEIARQRPLLISANILREAVDLAISADLDGADRVLCEISGGLDSAIIAGSLATLGRPAAAAINFWRDQAESDERGYAMDAARVGQVALDAVHRDLMRLDAEAFALSATSVRPNLAAVDPEHDQILANALAAAKADVLMTGNGGDVVFLQVGAAQIAADLLHGAPCFGSRIDRLADIARRTRRSVWSLVWETLSGRPSVLAPQRAPEEMDFILTRPDRDLHPWTSDTRGLTPARRVQIEGLVNSLGLTAHTRRGEAARIAHPLLAEPVVELCLRIPIAHLSSGEGERTLARQVFADRIPPSIAQRRSKGDVTTYFGRSIAASAGFLREFLLDGRLVAQGLIDPARLEIALTPESLIWRNSYGALLLAAGLEAWARHWEGRTGSGAGAVSGTPIASARNANARP